jgi:type III pantothenate kinase
MLLAVDIGNTRVGCALFEREEPVAVWGIHTDPDRAASAYGEDLRRAFNDAGMAPGAVAGALASSVVRGMIDRIGEAVEAVCGVGLTAADVSMDLGIRPGVPKPESVGVDRLLAAGEAHRIHEGSLVLACLGTAVTVDLVSSDGRFLGGTIAPGLGTALRSLHGQTSLLPSVDLAKPESVLGRGTRECIRAGVVYGAAGGIDRLSEELSLLVEDVPKLVLAGGDAGFIAPYLRTPHTIEPNLVLRGLASTYRRNAGSYGLPVARES